MASDWPIVDAGVDWMTCTGNTRSSRARLFAVGMRMLSGELSAGNEKRVWSFEGYKGFKSGGVQVGARPESAVLRLTGGVANEHYREAFSACDNVSRLDLQFTARVDHEPTKVIAGEYRRALRRTKNHLRGPSVDLWKSSRGSATLYLGSRASERCARVYDKGNESSHEAMVGCVRYEIELKGHAALHWTKVLVAEVYPRPWIVAQVVQFVESRGCAPRVNCRQCETIVLHATATDTARSLEWLRIQVRPTVARLLKAGLRQEVLDCLTIHPVGLTAPASSRRKLRKAS